MLVHLLLMTRMGKSSLMENQAISVWINQLSDGNEQAAENLWQHLSPRLQDFARQKLDVQTRRLYDENDVANSAFHSLCRGLAGGRIEAENRGALWGLLAVIAARKVSAKQRYLYRQKRGGGAVRGESGFDHFGDAGINQIDGNAQSPDVLAEVEESCEQLLNALPDETLKRIVLLKFQGATDSEVADDLQCTRRTIVRKLEKIRRIWLDFSRENLGVDVP